MQLRQAVNEFAQPLRRSMRRSVPLLVIGLAAQPKIGGQINDLAGQRSIAIYLFLRLPMRQGKEQHIHRIDLPGVAELELCALTQIGMHLIDVFAQVRV